MKFYQCKLRKGSIEDISWIPEKYAEKGKFLRIKDDNGWEVIEVFSFMDEKELIPRSQDYKKTRIASDI